MTPKQKLARAKASKGKGMGSQPFQGAGGRYGREPRGEMGYGTNVLLPLTDPVRFPNQPGNFPVEVRMRGREIFMPDDSPAFWRGYDEDGNELVGINKVYGGSYNDPPYVDDEAMRLALQNRAAGYSGRPGYEFDLLDPRYFDSPNPQIVMPNLRRAANYGPMR